MIHMIQELFGQTLRTFSDEMDIGWREESMQKCSAGSGSIGPRRRHQPIAGQTSQLADVAT
jgi:hypothetical protein